MRTLVPIAIALSLIVPALSHAQTSASYKLTEWTLNAGGDPRGGVSASSASFRVRLDAIGDPVAGGAAASASFRAGAGFVGNYPPPGEVRGFAFTDKISMVWSPDGSIGSYDVYRDSLSTLPGGFGACFTSGSSVEAAVDAGAPSSGSGWFYLVTAKNRLGEEGTKGIQTSGAERSNAAPCP